ncbi:MAG TPA: thiol peroxidase [bacterium]|nr:thiol peroxidase [bacterium]
MKVTLQGNPVTLAGGMPENGAVIPDAVLIDNSLNAVSLKDYIGKILILSSVPSLDTPVCHIETKKFNEEASALGEDVLVLTISMDLPFAQKRWCAAEGVDRVVTLSDHRDAAFGQAFGVLIKELRLDARAVFVVDGQGVLRYTQLVEEVSNEPDYEEIMTVVRELLKGE